MSRSKLSVACYLRSDVKAEAEQPQASSVSRSRIPSFTSIRSTFTFLCIYHGEVMASKSATYIAFNAVARRCFTTFTPTRHFPRVCINQRVSFLPPHNTLVSKANQGKKLSKNHFTSNRPSQSDQHQHEPKKQEKSKRKAAQRTQASSSLRRGTLIRGKGKLRHVDPEAETKDVTAYCAAETYNVHIARDELRKAGVWQLDPWGTTLFPQVLHVRTRSEFPSARRAGEEEGDVFVFPSGCVVTWNVSEKIGHQLIDRVLLPAAENRHPERMEAEDLEYIEDPSRQDSEVIGDTIILGTKARDTSNSDHSSAPVSESRTTDHQETDETLTKIAFSSALARSTKLAVLENSLTNYFSTTQSIPSSLAQGRKPRFGRAFILRKTGELLHIRAQLNLYSELTDVTPDMLWDSPHELGLEDYYEALGRELDVGQRIKVLNEKMDYASEIAAVLRERLGEKHSHLLEWIIIWLILIEVAYGSLHLWRERQERIDPASTTNLLRRHLERELERGGKVGR